MINGQSTSKLVRESTSFGPVVLVSVCVPGRFLFVLTTLMPLVYRPPDYRSLLHTLLDTSSSCRTKAYRRRSCKLTLIGQRYPHLSRPQKHLLCAVSILEVSRVCAGVAKKHNCAIIQLMRYPPPCLLLVVSVPAQRCRAGPTRAEPEVGRTGAISVVAAYPGEKSITMDAG